MLKRLKNNFESGVQKIRWFSSLLSDRMKIEISVIKLLHHADQMEKKRDELFQKIGRRVVELKEYSDRQIMKDGMMTDMMSEIEKINQEIEQTRKKASEISSTS